jgi:site-specific recombinase XerD
MTFVYDRRKRASSVKYGTVELVVTFERKRKYITTGIRLYPKEWRGGHVVGRIDAMELNDSLDRIMGNARKVVNAMLQAGKLCLDDIPVMMKKMQEPEPKEKKRTFMDYCFERMEVRQYGKTEDSQERYSRFMRFFKEWGGIVDFEDITEANIIRMDKVLVKKNLKDKSKWNNYHRFLNSFIIDAVDEGLIRRNPYKHVRINKDKSSGGLGKYLTPEEFRKIERMKVPTKSLERVRDLFVFQTFTCLSYVDLAAFDASEIRTVNGKQAYVGERGKTGQEYVFLLLEPARKVLKKYGGKLPMLSATKYNQYLKALAQHAGIDKPLSSHWARHTGATLLLNMGTDMEIVAKVLGHSSTKITREVYAKLLDETVVTSMAKIEKKLKEKK